MNSQPVTEQELEDLLRREFAASAVPDDGFTARVLRALPPRRRERPWLLPVAVTAGALLAWLSLLPTPLIRAWASPVPQLGTWVMVGTLMLVLGLLGCAWAVEEGE